MNIHKVTFILLIIGGLNWGLEAFNYGVGNYLPDTVSMIIYLLVATSAIYEIYAHKKLCRDCAPQEPAA